jgi:hypothetical protein
VDDHRGSKGETPEGAVMKIISITVLGIVALVFAVAIIGMFV